MIQIKKLTLGLVTAGLFTVGLGLAGTGLSMPEVLPDPESVKGEDFGPEAWEAMHIM